MRSFSFAKLSDAFRLQRYFQRAAASAGTPQTATPASAIRSWVIPAVAVLLGAVTAQPAAATRTWTNPSPAVVVGAVTATPVPASRTWSVPSVTVALGGVTGTPAPAVRSWTVPQVSVSLALASVPAPAVRTWIAKDATLSVTGPQTAIPLPAIRTWVALDPPPLGGIGGGGGYRAPNVKSARYRIAVTVPPAIRDWVMPPVHVKLGDVRFLSEPAIREWVALEPSVTTKPDPDEELLILLLTEKG